MKRRYVFSMLILFAATALWAESEPTPEELEQNQRRLEALRKQPELLARLRENLQSFQALKAKKQESILQLDRDLHELPANKQAKLWNALERYADWLDQLRKDDPQAWQAIKDAPDAATRLGLIKVQRDSQWMLGQSKAHRDEWAKLQDADRGQFVAKLRLEERQKHQRWLIAQRFWKELESQKTLPCRLSDFAFELKGKAKDKEPAKTVNRVETYVNDYLKPYMTVREDEQLREAEGRWPDYPMALMEIASRRTPALPPHGKELRKFDELPKPVKSRLTDAKQPKKLNARYHQLDGSAAFATRLVEMAAKDGKLPFEHEYLASNPASLQKAMKKFWDDDLVPAVKKDPDDFRKLTSSEGKWPDFPLAIQELARKHNLTPPWFVLPDQEKWHWERYRTKGRGPQTPES